MKIDFLLKWIGIDRYTSSLEIILLLIYYLVTESFWIWNRVYNIFWSRWGRIIDNFDLCKVLRSYFNKVLSENLVRANWDQVRQTRKSYWICNEWSRVRIHQAGSIWGNYFLDWLTVWSDLYWTFTHLTQLTLECMKYELWKLNLWRKE